MTNVLFYKICTKFMWQVESIVRQRDMYRVLLAQQQGSQEVCCNISI